MGCGWLGLPLAIALINEGYNINGTTTAGEKLPLLKKEKINPFLISLSENKITGAIDDFLKDTDTLIVNVPPKLRGPHKENYVQKMRLLHSEVLKANVHNIIFASSTAVYGDIDGEVSEKTSPTPTTTSGKQLLEAEHIFKDDASLKTTIIRFGGLIGANRHPVHMLSKRNGLANGNAPVNLIHLNDCIAIISSVLKNAWWNETINGVYPHHPSKQNYYTAKAIAYNIPPPNYEESNLTTGKIVLANNLIEDKKFKFTTMI